MRRWATVIGVLVGATSLPLLLAGGGGASSPPGASTPTTGASSGSDWTVYHGNTLGGGVATGVTSIDLSTRAWTSPALDGDLYGEPLAAGGRVFVATQNDTVYALSSSTGAIVWSTHLATPVPSNDLPCGDITPTVGITGTPVIDPARSEIFAVADEVRGGRPAHMLAGLDLATGKVELDQDVDPAGASPAALLQRTGLTLDAGRVVFGMGGNYGDCASYRGRVFSVPEAGGTPDVFSVDGAAGQSQGAVWMGGAAPVIDAGGNVWVSAGNGSVYSASQPYDDSDSVLELSPTMHLEQYFAPSTWATDNAHDLDMSVAPALLSDGQVVLAGKSRVVYLLNGSRLGGIGGQQASLADACGNDIDGGVAVSGTTVYLPCVEGPVAVNTSASPAALHLLWRASSGGGPPVMAAGLVWTIGQNGVLYGLDPATGAAREHVTVGASANHFPTPSVGDGFLFVPTADRVIAFAASSTSASTTTSSTAAGTSTTGVHTTTTLPVARQGTSPWVFAGAALAGLVAIGGLTWYVRRKTGR